MGGGEDGKEDEEEEEEEADTELKTKTSHVNVGNKSWILDHGMWKASGGKFK